MKRKLLAGILTLGLIASLVFPIILGSQVSAAEGGNKEWVNTWTEVENLGNGRYGATIYSGHQVFFDQADNNKPKKYKLTDNRPDFVVIQSAQVAIEIHPYYATFYDVQYQEVRLEEEQWVVQRLFKSPDTWRDVGAWNPVITVEEYDDASGHIILVTNTYDTDYGLLTVEYIQREASPLKHSVYFQNTSGSTETFRVLQKWAGIVGSKVNNKTAPAVTDETYLVFHDSNKPAREFNISENLYSMVYNSDGTEKIDQRLQLPINIQTSAGGLKADFIYGNWILADGEILEIDPDTATLNNPTVDGYIQNQKEDTVSCPFIYSWDGNEYVFDEEGLTRHVLPEYQGSQYSRLASLVRIDGEYKLKITEELLETTYLDRVTLTVVEHPLDTEVYTGFNNQLFTIKDRLLPLSAIDDVGKDVLYLLEDDEVFWNDNDFTGTDYYDYDGDGIADATSTDDLYKYLEVEFELPRNKDIANLVLQPIEFAQESRIWTSFLGSGEAIENYLHEVAVDGQIVSWFVQAAMFRIEVWDGDEWLPRGTVMEFPSHKSPTVVYPIDISGINTETLKVRFVGAPNEGGLDYVAVDYSEQEDLIVREIESDIDALLEIDGDYIILDTGDEVEIIFEDAAVFDDNKAYTYFANLNGYYRADSSYSFLLDKDELDRIISSADYTFRYLIPKFYPDLFSPSYSEKIQLPQGFLTGSRILLFDGSYKKIEELKLGDTVASYDFQLGEVVPTIVNSIQAETVDGTYLEINGRLRISPTTKVSSKNGWVSAKDLVRGDSILSFFGTYQKIFFIREFETEYLDWYLNVDEPSNFFVDYYLIHNRDAGFYKYTGNFEVYASYKTSGDQITRGFMEWDISSIDNATTITDTVLKYEGFYNDQDAHIHEMVAVQPSVLSDTQVNNESIWDESGEGTIYADVAGFPEVGTNKSIDLGTDADTDLEAQLSVDWFAIGLTVDNEASANGASIRSEEYGGVTPPPTLYVVYGTPTAATNLQATDGTFTDKVVVTWTKPAGATGYRVYEGANLLDTLGDVATYDDTAAPAGVITPGTATASDGTSTAHITLSVAGESVADGATRTYKVVAFNSSGDGPDSNTDTGYRGTGSITYQWRRSAGDSDASYGDLGGATTDPYNDTTAPAGTITPGTASASDGTSTAHITLSLAGESVADGAGRWYYAEISATGTTTQDTTHNRGYRTTGAITYQWQRSAGDSDAAYGNIGGATTDPYNDTAAPAPTITAGNAVATDGTSTAHIALSLAGTSSNDGAGRYYRAVLNATGATEQTSTTNRGYRDSGALSYQWQRSAGDSDASYSNLGGATSSTYNDTGAPAGVITPGTASASDGTVEAHVVLSVAGESVADGAGRYYRAVLSAPDASGETSGTNRGYRGTGSITYQWRRSAADSDAGFGNIGGATTDPYNDTGAPADGSGRWYYAEISATGTTTQDTTHDRGYRGVAPTATSVGVSGFDRDWAIANATVDTLGVPATVTEVGFDYGLTTAYGDSSTKTGSWAATDEFWMRLTGLTTGTVYHARAKVYNGSFWGYGADFVFSTEGSPTLYEYLNTGGDADGTDIYAGNWSYMQFTVGTEAHSADFANIYVKRTGTPGDAVLSIRHADGANKPTGTDLDIITLDGDLFSVALDWVRFDFPDDYTLESGESYALVLRAPTGTVANYLEWRWDAGGSLANAIGGKTTDSGITWTAEGTADHLFELWGEPVFEVIGANVFTGYLEDGDWLIVLTYRNYYKPYYPTFSSPTYFYIRLMDDTTMVSQISSPAWEYRPASFYLSKVVADTMEWGETDFKVRIYGDFTGNPYTDYNILPVDWRGTVDPFLDVWVIEQANIIEADTSVTLTEAITDRGVILNAAGRVMFLLGIPDLDKVSPGLFKYGLQQAGYEANTYTDAQQSTTDWEVKVGPTVAGWLNAGSGLLSITGDQTGMMIIVVLMLIIVSLLAMKGHFTMGVMLAFVPMLFGVWAGFISYIILGVVVGTLGLAMFAYKVWLQRG